MQSTQCSNCNAEPDQMVEFEMLEESELKKPYEAAPEREDTVCVITEENAPSQGSIGHPHHCADSCKYFWKQRGCKDGANCSHCHVCVYRHNKHRKSGRDKEAIRDRTATESTATTRCSITSEMAALPEAGECVECFGEL